MPNKRPSRRGSTSAGGARNQREQPNPTEWIKNVREQLKAATKGLDMEGKVNEETLKWEKKIEKAWADYQSRTNGRSFDTVKAKLLLRRDLIKQDTVEFVQKINAPQPENPDDKAIPEADQFENIITDIKELYQDLEEMNPPKETLKKKKSARAF